MDPRLLRAYNEELAYLRDTSREFAEEHDVVAGYLGLKTPNEPDPYVERLLEGTAFMAARVRLKLDDEFPEFTQQLLHAIQPNYLAPMPAICVAALSPKTGDPALMAGLEVPRKTVLTAPVAGHDTPCTFRTGHAVTLWPLQIEQAEYLSTRAAAAPFAATAGVRADSALRLRIRATGGALLSALAASSLPLFLAGSEHIPGELYRQIVGETVAVVGGPADGGAKAFVRLSKPQPYGFADECALLPHEGRSFRGYRILAEYFACPERFLFVELRDLDRAFSLSEDACDIVLLFRRASPMLEGAISPANLRPFCSPAINLFEKQLGRISIDPAQHEHLVMPDRTRPLDFEVFRLMEVTAYARTGGPGRPVPPLYAFGSQLYDWREALFHTVRLRLRRLSTKEQRLRRRNDYTGSETWISLTAPGDPMRAAEVTELGLRALVTNRELPDLLRIAGTSSRMKVVDSPVELAEIVRAPTRPRPPLGLADSAWRVIAHLTPNYASLVDLENDDASLLRDHLALYGRADDPVMRRQIGGILAISSEAVTRRFPELDRTAFARGRRIRVRLDDGSFENSGMFLFSAVVDRFLAEFASINSFTETIFESLDQGEVSRWPPRAGLRPTI